jgi:hypothetical protein
MPTIDERKIEQNLGKAVNSMRNARRAVRPISDDERMIALGRTTEVLPAPGRQVQSSRDAPAF